MQFHYLLQDLGLHHPEGDLLLRGLLKVSTTRITIIIKIMTSTTSIVTRTTSRTQSTIHMPNSRSEIPKQFNRGRVVEPTSGDLRHGFCSQAVEAGLLHPATADLTQRTNKQILFCASVTLAVQRNSRQTGLLLLLCTRRPTLRSPQLPISTMHIALRRPSHTSSPASTSLHASHRRPQAPLQMCVSKRI